jgi:hypothetical protein
MTGADHGFAASGLEKGVLAGRAKGDENGKVRLSGSVNDAHRWDGIQTNATQRLVPEK